MELERSFPQLPRPFRTLSYHVSPLIIYFKRQQHHWGHYHSQHHRNQGIHYHRFQHCHRRLLLHPLPRLSQPHQRLWRGPGHQLLLRQVHRGRQGRAGRDSLLQPGPGRGRLDVPLGADRNHGGDAGQAGDRGNKGGDGAGAQEHCCRAEVSGTAYRSLEAKNPSIDV